MALFLLGVVLFNPPLLAVFSTDSVVFGIPILFLYLFGAWIALIALLRLGASRRGDSALSQQPDEGG